MAHSISLPLELNKDHYNECMLHPMYKFYTFLQKIYAHPWFWSYNWFRPNIFFLRISFHMLVSFRGKVFFIVVAGISFLFPFPLSTRVYNLRTFMNFQLFNISILKIHVIIITSFVAQLYIYILEGGNLSIYKHYTIDLNIFHYYSQKYSLFFFSVVDIHWLYKFLILNWFQPKIFAVFSFCILSLIVLALYAPPNMVMVTMNL